MPSHEHQNVRLALSLDSFTIRQLEHLNDDDYQATIEPARRALFWSAVGGLSIILLAITTVGLLA